MADGPNWSELKVGDRVTRLLAETALMELVVTKVDDELIYCGVPGTPMMNPEHGWTFDRKTGYEVDEDLSWGPGHGITGSRLVPWQR